MCFSFASLLRLCVCVRSRVPCDDKFAVRLAGAGRLPEALACLEEALSARRSALGDAHPSVGATSNCLAMVYEDLVRARCWGAAGPGPGRGVCDRHGAE